MMVGGCRSVLPHHMTIKVWGNQPLMHDYVWVELQVRATASPGVVGGKVSFFVSRLPESGLGGALCTITRLLVLLH
jgi:hypothetical protein